ncbi:aspartate/glutamate racemase family protein [Amycolatopsis benzoatilytica]|uniref:aspartate/glutamate racemase family protein n=1 Tax=Amycolatopsis benzoatilytica TaxID=346045 RepID=UPI000362CBD5|nr:amino acid racemase [Amycolatopsis benzoatilytica]
MTPKTAHLVGILGGMGPAATADFYARLIRHTPARRDQDHLRVAVWADPTVPDRVHAVLNGTAEPYPALLDGASRLRDLGVTIAAMPCNTAHVFLPRLVAETGLRFVDMIEATVASVVTAGGAPRTAGLLGTRGVLHSRLYQDRLSAAGIRPVEPDADTQGSVDAAISATKRGDLGAAREFAVEAVRRMARDSVDAVVLACTELPLVLPRGNSDLPRLVDPADELAIAVVAHCRG